VSPILVVLLFWSATICSSTVTLVVSLLFPFRSLHYFTLITPLLHITLLRYIPIYFIYNNSLLWHDVSGKVQPRLVGQVHGIRGTFSLRSFIAHFSPSSHPLSPMSLHVSSLRSHEIVFISLASWRILYSPLVPLALLRYCLLQQLCW